MLLFVIIYIIFLALEIISKVVKIKKNKKVTGDSFLPTIFGFSFAASSVSSDMCTEEDFSKILFIYSIVYAIYWAIVQMISCYYNKKNDTKKI